MKTTLGRTLPWERAAVAHQRYITQAFQLEIGTQTRTYRNDAEQMHTATARWLSAHIEGSSVTGSLRMERDVTSDHSFLWAIENVSID